MGYRAVDAAELAAVSAPRWAWGAHDHTADGAEGVYAVLRGGGGVLVDGEEVPVRPGMFVAVDQPRPDMSAPARTA